MVGKKFLSIDGKGGREEISIFISNIPPELDKFGLKGIFQKVKKVYDAYIPLRQASTARTRFGFGSGSKKKLQRV